MRTRLAAAMSAAILLVGMLGAPTVPVMVGAAAAYAWLLWRSVATR